MTPVSIIVAAALFGIGFIVLRHRWRASIAEAERRGGARGFLHGRQTERAALASEGALSVTVDPIQAHPHYEQLKEDPQLDGVRSFLNVRVSRL